jgi:hypothetical protein|tara:strand:+ start:148 stop:375 length:228 start_codon:yes stop_codon:yes gene_type:complete
MVEENEMLMLLKELVDKVKALEETVYNQDNILMKSGYVSVSSPKPAMGNNTAPTSDVISKMEWDDIHKIVENIEG